MFSIFTLAKTVFKWLFSKPATLMYPVVPRDFFDKTRGHIDNDIQKCILCGLCERRCPAQALKVSKEKKTWEIDYARCIICNFCVEVCPVRSLRTEKTYSPSYVHAAEALTLQQKKIEGQ
jgi:ech hydrogenase subunit F